MKRVRPPARGTLVPAACLLVALTLTACGSTSAPAASGGTGGPGSAASGSRPESLQGTVTVLAAASLTESFDTIARGFEAAHPGVTVETSYGSSATLVQQANNGAPASLLALAGTAAAGPLDQSLVKGTANVATNVLEVAVPPGNPGKVTTLADLGRPDVKVVLCADTVPCGKAAQKVLARAGVTANVVSKEVDVKATLAKVKLGEADAAVVYHSDVVAAEDAVEGVVIPPKDNTTLEYPVVTLSDDPATRAFVAYVLGPRGRAALTSFGFGAP